MAEIVGVEVDCDDDLGAERARRRHRNRIDQRAVHQPAVADHHRREDSRQRIGGADRLDQTAVREPDLVAGRNFGGDGCELDRKVLDQAAADRLLELGGELAAADQAGAVQLDVEVAQHAARLQAARPFVERIQMAGDIGARRPRRRSRCRRRRPGRCRARAGRAGCRYGQSHARRRRPARGRPPGAAKGRGRPCPSQFRSSGLALTSFAARVSFRFVAPTPVKPGK